MDGTKPGDPTGLPNDPAGNPPEPVFAQLAWEDVLKEERKAIGLEDPEQANALCLSGGGIRSAAFCLGVLQSLEAQGLLDKFHYLSTVSGGGFIGSWLTRSRAYRRWAGKTPPPEPLLIGPSSIRPLRRYTNFLTPTPGLFSLDTWESALIWCRNTLINLSAIAPLMLLLVCFPIFYAWTIGMLALQPGSGILQIVLLIAAFASLTCAIDAGACHLPSHRHPDEGAQPASAPSSGTKGYGPTEAEVTERVVLPALAWVLLAPLAGVPAIAHGSFDVPFLHGRPGVSLLVLPGIALMASVCGYLIAWRRVLKRERGLPLAREHRQTFYSNLIGWPVASALSAGLLYGSLCLASMTGAVWVAVLGPACVMISDILRTTFYVAIRSGGIRADLDREWLARLNANKLLYVMMYTFIAVSSLKFSEWAFPRDAYTALISVAGFATGPVVAFVASSAKLLPEATARRPGGTGIARSGKGWLRLNVFITAIGLIFLTTTLMLCGRLAMGIAMRLPALFGSRYWTQAFYGPAILEIAILLGFCLFLLNLYLKVNRFSLHAYYRNRLIRGFLGTAVKTTDRRPDSYTGFDPSDNLRMWDCIDRTGVDRLFPVINVTMNLTASPDTAHLDRKGAPFTITPQHCGSYWLLKPGRKLDPDGKRSGCYVHSCYYAGGTEMETGPEDKMLGISLGTAMTISGAAVSPNMGYYSSPLAAFIMTLFNLRLGAWLPNPAMAGADELKMKKTNPVSALASLLGDLTGRSDDSGNSLYLSDGGHFDNLGLYEMLRRKCRRIVVIDAGADAEFECSDLCRTIAYAEIDGVATVKFDGLVEIPSRRFWNKARRAAIKYKDAPDGELICIKPCLSYFASAQLQAYKASHPDFPHVSTTDQFFTELTFESYRELGMEQAAAASAELAELLNAPTMAAANMNTAA
ncbi:patatin-like phospholipase family protein [Lichenicoccus sp.]|uniref:patatin-like phospholipase family protein n=1 Tax=Lichenicoccus sp. TaxID=2781899 RepID=UPI003D0E82CB